MLTASYFISFALAGSLLAASPSHANGGGTTVPCKVNGVDSGSFTVDNNVVTTNSSCAGVAVIPDGVVRIKEGAFNRATALTSITIPGSVTTIGSEAFLGATALSTVDFAPDSSLTSIKDNAFYGADALVSITIPASVTSIEESAFSDTESLETVTFEAGSLLSTIGDYAFSYTESLETVTFLPGSKLENIGNNAFRSATALKTITFAKDSILKVIDEGAFKFASSLTTITIPASVTRINDDAFADSRLLNSIYFLGNAPQVDDDAFDGTGSRLTRTAYIKSGAEGFTLSNYDNRWNGLMVAVGVYTYSFDSKGGSSIDSGLIISGGQVMEPTAPTRSGHTFDGWSAVDGGDIITFPYSPGVNRDITLFAKWTADAVPTTDSNPAASAPAAVTKTAKSVSNTIRFSTSTKVLTKSHKAKLKKSVKASGVGATYVVTGTAGMLPGATKAQVRKLAKLRANVIKAYLVKLGVNKANISIELKITNQGIVPKTKTLAKYLVS